MGHCVLVKLRVKQSWKHHVLQNSMKEYISYKTVIKGSQTNQEKNNNKP